MATALNGRKRISHIVDDNDENIMTTEALFCVKDETISGEIMVVLWGEELTEKALMDVQIANQKNVTIKKIYLAGTTIGINDFFLLR